MPKVKSQITISLDGYMAGPNQSAENPLGEGGEALHEWALKTAAFSEMHGRGGDGERGPSDDVLRSTQENLGAVVMGRNMFGPIRGPWPDEEWKGWWGDDPPYHAPTFVLTHYPRGPIEMDGGTTFYFVTEGIEAALEQAKLAAKGRDVKIGGGVETVRQYLRAGLIDELHFVLSPVVLGQGEAIFAGIDLPALGYRVTEHQATDHATHIVLSR